MNLKPKPPRKRVRTASRPHPTGQTPVQEAFAYIAANAKALPLAKTRGEALNIIQNWLAMTSTNRDDT